MNAHIQEIQEKFQNRFEKLEEEVRNKEETINKLKAKIFEMERAAEDSFTVNINLKPYLHIQLFGFYFL